jgi:hypothetical protein
MPTDLLLFRLIYLLVQGGLLNFNISSVYNGIALCGLCHTNFDCAHDPGLVIVPSDLDFLFIKFEKDNDIQRSDQARNGIAEPRVCPTVPWLLSQSLGAKRMLILVVVFTSGSS